MNLQREITINYKTVHNMKEGKLHYRKFRARKKTCEKKKKYSTSTHDFLAAAMAAVLATITRCVHGEGGSTIQINNGMAYACLWAPVCFVMAYMRRQGVLTNLHLR